MQSRFDCERCGTEWGFPDLTVTQAIFEKRTKCPRCKQEGSPKVDAVPTLLQELAPPARDYWTRIWFGIATAEALGIVVYAVGRYYGWL